MKIVINDRIWKVGDKGVIGSVFDAAEQTGWNTIAGFTVNHSANPTEFNAINKYGEKLLTFYTNGMIVDWEALD